MFLIFMGTVKLKIHFGIADMKRLEDGDFCDQNGSDQCQIFIRLKLNGDVVVRTTSKPNYGHFTVDINHTFTTPEPIAKNTKVEIEAYDRDPLIYQPTIRWPIGT